MRRRRHMANLHTSSSLIEARAVAVRRLDACATCFDCSPFENEPMLLALTAAIWFEQQRQLAKIETDKTPGPRRSPAGIISNSRHRRGERRQYAGRN